MLPSTLALAALAPAAPHPAQDPVAVVIDGDFVPGVGFVERIDFVRVTDTGSWIVEVDTDNTPTTEDGAVLTDAGVLYREGEFLSAPAGSALGGFDSLALARDGSISTNFFLDGLFPGVDSGVFIDGALRIQEGDAANDPALSPGTTFLGFFDVKRNASGVTHLLATIDDPNIPSTLEQALFIDDGSGTFRARLVEGDVLPGQTAPVVLFGSGPHQSAVDDGLGYFFRVELNLDPTQDVALYLDDGTTFTKIAQEGDPSPVAGRAWENFLLSEVALADGGHIAFSGQLDGDSASDTLIVRNGAKFVQEGDSLTAIAPFALTGFGSGPLDLARTGQLAWFGDWDDPDTSRDTGIFVDDELVVQEGVTTVGGIAVAALSGIPDGYSLSPNGRWLIFEARLADGRDGAFLVDLSLGAASVGCDPPNPNSRGIVGRLSATGSDVAGGEPLRFVAQDLPFGQFGFLVTGTQVVNQPFAGGSQGVLCLGGMLGRFDQQIVNTGAVGYAEVGVDTTAIPVNPVAAVLAGETWSFQLWHRDLNPGVTSNFTGSVSITFQ
ncbi:MAG: hypothetical protein AAFU73_22450 [Planctomycetota bacterium]